MTPPLTRVELRRMAEAVNSFEAAHGVFLRRHYTEPIVTLLDDLEAAEARIEALRNAVVDALVIAPKITLDVTHMHVNMAIRQRLDAALLADAEAAK